MIIRLRRWVFGRASCDRRKSFTLIELLVVVAVILILVGISLRIMQLVNRKGAISRTTWILEQVKNALAGYYASYGSYPPSDKYDNRYGSSVSYIHVEEMPAGYDSCRDWHTSTGLVFYLTRVDEAGRWSHYIKDPDVVPNETGRSPITNATYALGPIPPFTNIYESIHDAWDVELRYVCTAGNGYQGYRLWSVGPNNKDENGGGDDLGVTSGE